MSLELSSGMRFCVHVTLENKFSTNVVSTQPAIDKGLGEMN